MEQAEGSIMQVEKKSLMIYDASVVSALSPEEQRGAAGRNPQHDLPATVVAAAFEEPRENGAADPVEVKLEAESRPIQSANLEAPMITAQKMGELTWVQREALRREMEIAKLKEEAENQWKPLREYHNEEFAFVAVKGEWKKADQTQPPKKKRSFFGAMNCMKGTFSMVSGMFWGRE